MQVIITIIKIYLIGIPIIGLILSLLTDLNSNFLEKYISIKQKAIESAKAEFSEEERQILDMANLDIKDHLGFTIFSDALSSWFKLPFIINVLIQSETKQK